MPTVTVRSLQSFTAHGNQTIPLIAAHDCVVFLAACVEDTIGTPTVGGVSMTGIGRRPTFPGAGGGYAADIWYLPNASGGAVGTNITWVDPYTHSNNFLGALYVLSNVDVSQPQSTGGSESTNAADPQFSMDCNDGDLILAVMASANGSSENDGQSRDFSVSSAGEYIVDEQTAVAGSNNQSWTMSSGAFALSMIAIKAGTPPATVPGNFFRLF